MVDLLDKPVALAQRQELRPEHKAYLAGVAELMAFGTTEQQEYETMASEMALGLIPPDEDVANAAVFFASDLSRVITGQALNVNGGEVFT